MSMDECEGYSQIEPVFKPWVRRECKLIMTDEEQRKINKAVEDALIAKCGYGHGPVVSYSEKQIAEAQARGEITPLERIREPDIQEAKPWALNTWRD